MYFSYNELKKLANLPNDITPDKMSKAITSIGFEVEEVKKFLDVEGIMFGKILKLYKNPDADNLNVCEVLFKDKKRIIQTTAKNLKENDVVIAFVPGSRVGNIVFSEKEMQGIVSEGMLSTPSEYGINKDICRKETISGITCYKEIDDLNIDPIEYLGLDDYIIEVDILSNRSDANSYYVMAHELAAKFHTHVNLPKIKQGNFTPNVKVKGSEIAILEAKNNFDISIKEQIFLNKHNVKSINNAADLTNLTLLYSGQPAHAYDSDNVGRTFEVKEFTGRAKVFGNKDVDFEKDQMVFIDDIPVCVASVIGLEGYDSSAKTENILLELGIFNITGVRQAVKKVKLNTAASSQASKALSKGTTFLALNYLTNKLKDFSNPINLNNISKKYIDFDQNIINRLVGKDLTNDPKYLKAVKSLEILGFVVENSQMSIPNYRHDVENMADIAEEIFRFYGYDNFLPTPPSINVSEVKNVKQEIDIFVNMGYQEIKTYALISHERNLYNPFSFSKPFSLETYVSKEREVVRYSQAESLQETAEYNFKRGMKEFAFVSKGMISNQKFSIALITNLKSFIELKQELINVIPGIKFERLISENLHPGVSAKITLNNKEIGWIGKIHPQHQKVDAFIAEIFADDINKKMVSFSEYVDAPLKFKDYNISLKNKEDLGPELAKYKKAYSVKVIDQYQEKDILKVTIRVVD